MTEKQLIRKGNGGLVVGQSESDGKVRRTITAVGKPYYHGRNTCDEQDCHCHDYGWRTPYTAIDEPITDEAK